MKNILTDNEKKDLILKSIKIRFFEEKILSLFEEGLVKGTTHTCIGQELHSVYISSKLNSTDTVISNHRGHGHFLSLTNDYIGLAQELLGKAPGITGGWGGSQHLYKKNLFYSNGILGGTSALASGISLYKKKNNKIGKTICFLGDGAFGEGIVYESLNFNSIHSLKTIFVVEDNKISQSTKTSDVLSGDFEKKFKAFDIHYMKIEINTLEDFSQIDKAFDFVEKHSKPIAIHIDTNRLSSHSKGDDTRSNVYLDELKKNDLLLSFMQSMEENDPQNLNIIKSQIDKIFEKARNSKDPVVKNLIGNPLFSKKINKKEINQNTENYGNQINESLNKILNDFNDTIFIGEDILDPYGGAFKIAKNLSSNFKNQVFSTSISEALITGLAGGYSIMGGKSIVEIMFGDFLTLSFDQILNHVCKYQKMYNINENMHFMIRTPMGGRRGYGPTHSQSIEKHFLGVDNLYVISPNVLHPIDKIYESSIASGVPTLMIENKLSYGKSNLIKKSTFFNSKNIGRDFSYMSDLRNFDSNDDHILIMTYGSLVFDCMKVCDSIFINQEINSRILVPSLLSPIDDELLNLVCNLKPSTIFFLKRII